MKELIALACLGFAFAVSAPAFAGAQQEKMKGCNIEAKGMKGDERNAFMSKCLKKDYVLKSASPAAAPAKMDAKAAAAPKAAGSTCEAKAAEKKLAGAAKNSFMKKCEADSAATPAAKAPDANAACAAKAAEKKLAGAAKDSFMKKCVADAGK
jgi:hypothetical protein